MDVWCSSCWVQFRVGAEYPGHLCHEKNPVPMIARLRKRRKRKQKEEHHNSDSPQDQVCHGTLMNILNCLPALMCVLKRDVRD